MRTRSFRWVWLALAFAPACARSAPSPKLAQVAVKDVKKVVVRHAWMTYVMDSSVGQRDKARAAVAGSKLVEAIAARRYEVEIRFDATAGDDVIVDGADGRELGRAPLHDVAGGAAPAQILDRL